MLESIVSKCRASEDWQSFVHKGLDKQVYRYLDMAMNTLDYSNNMALFFPEKFNSDKKLLAMAESLASLTSKNYKVLAYNQRHVLLSFVNELVDLEKTEGVGV